MASHENDELVDVLQAASKRRSPGAVPTPEQATATSPAPEATAPLAEPPAATAPDPLVTTPLLPKESQPAAAPTEATIPATEYVGQLLKTSRHKKGKGIQLDSDNHRALTHIANTMGGITIADLLHNIVRLHFQEYGPAIQQMLKEKEAQNKKEKLPFQRS